QHLRALPDELARSGADHLLEEAVAALDIARAHEGDADRGVVEDQLLLAERALHALLALVLLAHQPPEVLLRAAPLGDVLHDRHRAAVRVERIHRAALDAAPERGAVLAPAQLDAARGLAARQSLVDRGGFRVLRDVGVQHRGGLALELARAVAVHLLVT